MAMFTLGTGIGGGIILDDRVLEGRHSHGAEVGHMKIDLGKNRQCGCGRWGCLEAFASATSVVKRAQEAIADQTGPSILRDLLAATDEELPAKVVFQAAAQGDNPFAEQYRRWLKDGLSIRLARRNVARSLSATLWGLWKNGTAYHPDWVGVAAAAMAAAAMAAAPVSL